MSQSVVPVAPNPQFGRYEVLFRIAAGGMAEVYVARIVGEGGFEKLYALKRMLPTLAEDERFVGMFLDEGRVAANISSPHVVQTLDLGRAEDDSLYLVMELVVGVSLSALMRVLAKAKEEIPVALAADIIAQAALGLHDAHEARTLYGEPLGIVHRDISPQNVLVDVSGRVRITDFGVARAVERVTQTQSGEVKGKLGYFAPEQARAQPIDRRADIYALGIVAWELFTGRRLFAGDGPAETLLRVLEMQVPRVDEVRPEVPAAVADAIAHALDRDVEKRTKTAGELAQALRAALPSAGPTPLGQLVRARGGESLLRLEEGIRSQNPSSPSGRYSSPSKVALAAALAAPSEEGTTRTPSVVSRVVERGSGVSTSAAPVAPIEVAIPIDAEPAPERSNRGALYLGVGALVVALLLALGGLGYVLTREPAVVATALAPHAASPSAPAAVLAAPPAEVVPAPAIPSEATAEVVARVSPETAPASDEVAPVAPTPSAVPGRPATGTAGRARRARPRPSAEGPDDAPSAGRRPGALRGMDDFEAELGE